MYSRYINEIQPMREEMIEIDVSEKFAELKFEHNREAIYHVFVSWKKLGIHNSNAFTQEDMNMKLAATFSGENNIVEVSCKHPMKVSPMGFYATRRDVTAK